MEPLHIPETNRRWDCISLGEVMLRLDPGEGRIHTTRNFTVWEGGGEYNVARGLRQCFGLQTAIVTALADNAVGRLWKTSSFRAAWTLRSFAGCHTTGWAAPSATVSISPNAASASAPPPAAPTAATPPSARSSPATSTGQKSSVVQWRRAGCTPAASSPPSPPHRRSRRRSHAMRHGSRHSRQLRPQLPRLPLAVHRRQGQGPGSEPRTRPQNRPPPRERRRFLCHARCRTQRRDRRLLRTPGRQLTQRCFAK